MTVSHMTLDTPAVGTATDASVRPPPRKTAMPVTSYAVLGLLSLCGELSGYDIKKLADHSIGLFYWSPAMSNIYAELRRLEALGHIEPVETGTVDTRNRRLVRITASGQDALTQWLPEPIPSPVISKDHLLLKVWLGQAGEVTDLIRLVDEEHAAVGKTLESATYNLKVLDEAGAPRFSPPVYRFCARMAEARIGALAELRDELSRQLETHPEEGQN